MPRSKASKASNACTGNVQITQHASPLGPLWSHWTPQRLASVKLANTSERPRPTGLIGPPTSRSACSTHCCRITSKAKTSLGMTLCSTPRVGPPSRNGFTDTALEIPLGHTITYQELARLAGNKKASRAVGAAMSRNRILLIIPCHRVVSTSGNLQGYSAKGGINTKRLLLELERQGQWPHDLFDQGQNR